LGGRGLEGLTQRSEAERGIKYKMIAKAEGVEHHFIYCYEVDLVHF